MKIKSTLLALLILSAFRLNAQQPEVIESEMPMSLGSRPGFTVKVANIEMKDAEKLWNDYVKNEFSSRLKSLKSTGEFMAEGSKLSSLSKEQFNLYSTITASGNDVLLKVWIDMGNSFLYKEGNPKGTEIVKAKLVDFAFYVRKEDAKKTLQQEEDKLKDAEKVLSRLVNDGESINNDIRNHEDKIERAKHEKEKNRAEQDVAKSALEAQKLKVLDAQKSFEKIGK